MAKDPFKQLNIIKKVSQNGKPVVDCFRLLYKHELWLKAYLQLRPQEKCRKTLNANYLKEIEPLIENLKKGTFRSSFFNDLPGNKAGKEPPFHDLLLLETMKYILQSVYGAQRLFPTGKFRETTASREALKMIKKCFYSFTWCIKGEIFADTLNIHVLRTVLAGKINDKRFLYLLQKVLASKILEYKQAESFRLLMEHIYLLEIDQFVKAYRESKFPRKRGEGERTVQMQYVRFGREFAVGLSCTKKQAFIMQKELEAFLKDRLQIDSDKESRIFLSHLSKTIPFLGYKFCKVKKMQKKCFQGEGKFSKPVNADDRARMYKIVLLIPKRKMREFARKHGYGRLENGATLHRKKLLHKSEQEIAEIYHAELKRFAQYYSLAANFHHMDKLIYLARGSFLKTIAAKRKSTVAKTAKRLKKQKQEIVSRRAVYFERSTYGSEGGEETCCIIRQGALSPTLRSHTEQRGY